MLQPADESVHRVTPVQPWRRRLTAKVGARMVNPCFGMPGANLVTDPEARLRLAEVLVKGAAVRWQFFDLPRTEPLFARVLETRRRHRR
ncbi:MAG: hypothetical protein MUC36_04170 [Planctomycetes bacterium]|jgi:hypothetical protein|nr:hypothetical protein [Planctomycetota bacterium]